MSIFNDISTGSGSTVKNTGAKSNHIEGKLLLPMLSNGAEFADVTAFKTLAALKTFIQSKSIIPLFEAYALADASTEAEKFEEGNFSFVIEKNAEKITFENYITLQAYEALKSYEDSPYKELFEITDKGELIGSRASDGIKVKGRAIKSFIVSRTRSVKEKMAFAKVEINFADADDILDAVMTKGDYDDSNVPKVHDIDYAIQGTPTATALVIQANTLIGNVAVTGMLVADFIFTKDSDGSAQTLTLDTEVNGLYTFSGTGLVTGKLNSNAVLDKTTIMYEGVEEQVTI